VKDRKSTSGGAWFLGNHCIKTWSSTQGAFALSSAEAELYAMIEGTTRAKGLHSLAKELGFTKLANIVKPGTDSSAAKSFVSRRGLGKMRHLEIRDLWLQQQVREGLVEVSKVPGERNTADLMTKILPLADIRVRVADLGMEMVEEKVVGSLVGVKKVSFIGSIEIGSMKLTFLTPTNEPTTFSSTISIPKSATRTLISASGKILVMRSAVFLSPGTLDTSTSPSRTCCWSQRSRISRCLIFPKPLLDTKLFAALLSVPGLTMFASLVKPSSFANECSPFARVVPSIIA
jgi:hypothetical protein